MTCDQYKTRLALVDESDNELYNIIKDDIITDLGNNCLKRDYNVALYGRENNKDNQTMSRVAARLAKELSDKGFHVVLLDDMYSCTVLVSVEEL